MHRNGSHRHLHTVSRKELDQMRRTHAWRKLSEQVRREEPTCRLGLPGCTGVSEVSDHIIPASQAPDLFLERSNVRGSCKHCNDLRGRLPVEDFYEPPALRFFDTD
jgi:5-methylcytosine-specific restriction endonuclease McrA